MLSVFWLVRVDGMYTYETVFWHLSPSACRRTLWVYRMYGNRYAKMHDELASFTNHVGLREIRRADRQRFKPPKVIVSQINKPHRIVCVDRVSNVIYFVASHSTRQRGLGSSLSFCCCLSFLFCSLIGISKILLDFQKTKC